MGKQGVGVTKDEIYMVIKSNDEGHKVKDISKKTGLSTTKVCEIIEKYKRGGYDNGLFNAETHIVRRNGKAVPLTPLLNHTQPYIPKGN